MKILKTLGFGAVALCASTALTHAETIHVAWVQYDSTGAPQARVVVDTAVNGVTKCPVITHDTGTLALTLRSDIAPTNFDMVRVCVGTVTPQMTNMTVAGTPLPTPTTNPQKVAVIGDTGCRIKSGTVQNCLGTPGQGPAWNYKGIAQAAASEAPDLLIHVGDYHYRESGFCGTKCDQATVSYSWLSWTKDFIEPSKSLFAAAPWVMGHGAGQSRTM